MKVEPQHAVIASSASAASRVVRRCWAAAVAVGVAVLTAGA
ncbi:MAG: hypothetical protein JWN68_1030 [Nocardioides sp.]|jgi:hypothetical protein|nr:hypothetical protein [Nocardioides sp.]